MAGPIDKTPEDVLYDKIHCPVGRQDSWGNAVTRPQATEGELLIAEALRLIHEDLRALVYELTDCRGIETELENISALINRRFA